MKILFWGTPAFAVPSLRALDDEGFDIVGVVTQPDRPAGRGRRLTPSAVKQVALEQGFEVFTPDRARTEDFVASVQALEPDLSVVVAYGQILRREVLDIARLGSIHVHAALLPELRGAAPINWAIVRGHEESGVTIMRMVEAMDAGPIIHTVREPILADQTAEELTIRLSELGAEALVEALAFLGAGASEEVEQDHERAPYAPKFSRDVARIDWTKRASEVANHVRGMDALPGAWTELGAAPIKLFRPTVWNQDEVAALGVHGPGTNGGPRSSDTAPTAGFVLRAMPDEGVLVMAGEGAVCFAEVQPPGRRRMSATDWIIGRNVEPGQRFE